MVWAKVCDLTEDLLWFVCGLYVGILTTSLTLKTTFLTIPHCFQGLHVNFEFIQHGGHLCALGAFIQSNIED